ncbi:unnamed protein product [Paramecium sonneborni]|uniref:Uncharacterized protein n=1 Tax=Paramecium sonneborni TaxID=65129 RepID=A0A8S1RU80_9CILI|nr:unnamed protein product [Paramecium sonneborni]
MEIYLNSSDNLKLNILIIQKKNKYILLNSEVLKIRDSIVSKRGSVRKYLQPHNYYYLRPLLEKQIKKIFHQQINVQSYKFISIFLKWIQFKTKNKNRHKGKRVKGLMKCLAMVLEENTKKFHLSTHQQFEFYEISNLKKASKDICFNFYLNHYCCSLVVSCESFNTNNGQEEQLLFYEQLIIEVIANRFDNSQVSQEGRNIRFFTAKIIFQVTLTINLYIQYILNDY